jgi:hypothetical protein
VIDEVARHVMHDSHAQRAAHGAPDGHGVLRVAVQEVRRPIERVDDPHHLRVARDRRTQLFAQYA